MSTLDRLFSEASSLADYAKRYAAYITDLLATLDCDAIQRVGDRLEAARKARQTVYVIGNGGSASTASHFANDLALGPRRNGGAVYRAISLADNVSQITATANDVAYECVFVEQLKTLMSAGDLVLAISASGNSPNVVKAAEYAKSRRAYVIALTGFAGGRLRELADDAIHIATPNGDYGPVEDLHLLLDHLLTSYLTRLTAFQRALEAAATQTAPLNRALGPETALRVTVSDPGEMGVDSEDDEPHEMLT